MSTLNARANQAWRDMEAKLDREDCVPNFVSEQDAWEEGWEIGYKAACAEQDNRLDQVDAAAYDAGWNAAKEDGKL